MKLDCGAVLSKNGVPYMVVHGSWDNIKAGRNYVLVNLYLGARWSDNEFTLPITLEQLNQKYSLEFTFEGYLNGKQVRESS